MREGENSGIGSVRAVQRNTFIEVYYFTANWMTRLQCTVIWNDEMWLPNKLATALALVPFRDAIGVSCHSAGATNSRCAAVDRKSFEVLFSHSYRYPAQAAQPRAQGSSALLRTENKDRRTDRTFVGRNRYKRRSQCEGMWRLQLS